MSNSRRGRPSNLGMDPSGQRMVYVSAVGPMSDYENRYATYREHPPMSIARSDLARGGFYYTGYKDTTKCYNCGMGVSNWGSNDWPTDPYFHGQGCTLATNTPPSGRVEQNTLPQRTMEMLGERFSGSFNREAVSEPMEQELTQACNPQMSNMLSRMESFRNATWMNQLNIQLKDLASAGFFYFGESDRVKCFFCNGGLQNWSRNDNPWEEHAKAFPHCGYLYKEKGPQFISKVNEQKERSTRSPAPAAQFSATSTARPAVPSSGVCPELRNQLKTQAFTMGFSEDLINKAYELEAAQNHGEFANLTSLLEILMRLEEDV